MSNLGFTIPFTAVLLLLLAPAPAAAQEVEAPAARAGKGTGMWGTPGAGSVPVCPEAA